jgi:hypothetical protein
MSKHYKPLDCYLTFELLYDSAELSRTEKPFNPRMEFSCEKKFYFFLLITNLLLKQL